MDMVLRIAGKILPSCIADSLLIPYIFRFSIGLTIPVKNGKMHGVEN